MESQENKSQEQPLPHKEQSAIEASEEVNEQQLESVQGGGLKRLPPVAHLTEFTKYNPNKRTASEAGMTNYVLDTKIPRIGNMKDVSGK